MKPDPQVPQQQADRHVQEPHVELLRRRPNPALVHLPIARLDPEPFPVRLLHPVDPPGGDPPVRVEPMCRSSSGHAGPPTAAASRRSRPWALSFLPSLRVWRNHPLFFSCLKMFDPLGAFGMIGLAAVADNWHEERPPRPLQVADDRHAVEAAVQQRTARASAPPCSPGAATPGVPP